MNLNKNRAIAGLLFSWIVFFSPFVYAWSIVVPDISGTYAARILMDRCDQHVCEGPASISLFSLSTHEKVADLRSDDFSIGVSSNFGPDKDLIADVVGGEIVIGDFNFDGHDDIAIHNGYNGSYGYASYDVYTYDAINQSYVLNADLARLTGGEYLGMFRVDKKRKRLLTINKAADRVMFSFEFISDIRGVRKVCEKDEVWDMQRHSVNVTVKTLRKNGWVTRKRVFSDARYDFNKMAKFGRCSFVGQ